MCPEEQPPRAAEAPGSAKKQKRGRFGASAETTTRRVARAVEWLCDGTLTRGEIADRLVAEFKVSRVSAYRSIKQAREDVLPSWVELSEQKVLVAETLARATRHYQRCVRDEQHGPGLATLKWIAELLGVKAIIKVEVDGKLTVDGKLGLGADHINSLRAMFGLPPREPVEPAEATEAPVDPAG